MKRQTLRWTVATAIGLASDFLPVPGMLGAALVFPQGAEGDHGIAYLVLALSLNFALFFGLTFLIFELFSKNKASN
jgi:hypothetical protein